MLVSFVVSFPIFFDTKYLTKIGRIASISYIGD